MWDLAIDSRDYLYIVGSNDGQIVLNTYHLNGSVVHFDQLGSSGSEEAKAIAIDSSDNLYLTGWTSGDFGDDTVNAGIVDLFLMKIDTSTPTTNHILWTKQRGSSRHDNAYDLSIDSHGNIYVVGSSNEALDGEAVGDLDIILERYSPNGVLTASRQLGSAAKDIAYGIDIDNTNQIFVTGTSDDNAFIAKFKIIKDNLLSNGTLVECINTQLGADSKHIPTLSEMEEMTTLVCENRSLSSIEGIGYLSNLNSLRLGHNAISDISHLASLSKLTYLDLSFNDIQSIASLSGLTNLIYLHLTDIQIENIVPLQNLSKVETLTISTNIIEDISALQGMSSLRFLHAEENKISNIEALSALNNLETVYFNSNCIQDFSPLPASVELHGADQQCSALNLVPILTFLLF